MPNIVISMLKSTVCERVVANNIIIGIICFFIFFVYNPMYSVTLNGEFIGYTEDKKDMQDKIDEYQKSGDNKTIAFVDIETLPEYKLCLLKNI